MRSRLSGLRAATPEEKDQMVAYEDATIIDLYYLRNMYEDPRSVEVIYTNTTPIMYIRVYQRALSNKQVYYYRYFRIWTEEMVEIAPASRLDWRKEGF